MCLNDYKNLLCHPERSEGSLQNNVKIPRFTRNDIPLSPRIARQLEMSNGLSYQPALA